MMLLAGGKSFPMESSPCIYCVMSIGGSGHHSIDLGTVETA